MIGLPNGGGGGRRRPSDDEGSYTGAGSATSADDDVEEQLLMSELNGFHAKAGRLSSLASPIRRPFWNGLHVQRTTVRLTVAFVLACVIWAVFIMLPGGKIVAKDGRTLLSRHWTVVKEQGPSTKMLKRWRVPRNTKVVGLVFFGRRRTASLLSCYLERNLKRNGGVLDEVIWMQGTSRADDVEWMHALVNATDGYASFYNKDFAEQQLYSPAYSVVFAEEHKGPVVYVKIDDDIVFMEDIAITSIVHRLLTDPKNPYLVGANVVNQAALSWVHYSLGGVDGYLPELEAPPPPPEDQWPGGQSPPPPAPSVDPRSYPEPLWSGPPDYQVPREYQPPKPKGNRWLPLPPGESLDRTPIAKDETFDPFASGLMWWPIGAQQHYSFLGKLKRNEVQALKFDVWDFNYVRMGIQFFAIRREDIVSQFPFPNKDDEHFLSITVPKQLGRRGLVDGRSVVSHYSYGPQYGGMDTTDIFDRYRAFAEDNICYSPEAVLSAIPPTAG